MADPTERIDRSQVEVVGLDGKEAKSGQPLSDIFDKIEAGISEGKTATQVLNQPEVRQEVKEGSTKEEGTKSLVKPDKAAEPVVKAEPVKEEKVESTPSSLEAKLDERQAEVSRDGLLKQIEKKPETKAEEKKEEVKVEEKKEDEVPEDELKPLPHDSQKTTKRIHALLKKATEAQEVVATTKKELEARDAKLKELESELGKVKSSDPRTNDAVKSQLDELAMLKRRYELEKDPEVKTKFDSKIESAETQVTALLKDRGAAEGLLNLIKEEGGWAKFASSNKPVTMADGKVSTQSEVAELVSKSLPYSDRKTLEAAVTEQIQVSRDKQRYVKEQQDTATRYFEEREKAVAKEQEEWRKKSDDVTKLVKDSYDEALSKNDWLKEKEVPASADEDTKKQIQESNKFTKDLQALLQKNLATRDLKEAVQITFDATRFVYERKQNQILQDQLAAKDAVIAAKEAEIAKFKNGGRTVAKGGSISTSAATKVQERKPTSLEDAFDRIGQGEILVSNEA